MRIRILSNTIYAQTHFLLRAPVRVVSAYYGVGEGAEGQALSPNDRGPGGINQPGPLRVPSLLSPNTLPLSWT